MTLRTLLLAALFLTPTAAPVIAQDGSDRPFVLPDFLRHLAKEPGADEPTPPESLEIEEIEDPFSHDPLAPFFSTQDFDFDHDPYAFDAEPAFLDQPSIPPDPPSAVFETQPEDRVAEIAQRETFPFQAFDFSEGTPTIDCLPARVCSIELEAGEIILGRAMGDPDRWLYQELPAGNGEAQHVLLAFMPKVFGARTNLIVTTNRRVYTLALVSAEVDKADTGPSAPLTERARFRYPQTWAEARSVSASEIAGVVKTEKVTSPSASPDDLDFRYAITEPRKVKRRFHWRPTVYDDGAFTYVLLPKRLATLPVVRGLDANHEPFPLNETYHRGGRGTYVTIPRLVNQLEIFLGVGSDRKSMTVQRNVRLP